MSSNFPNDHMATGPYPVNNITARVVADYFLALANECEELITNMKLNILVYYTQAWHLAVFNRPLFANEIEAWVHGPVLPTVYDTYKRFRWTPIITDDLNLEEFRGKFSPEQQEILDDITEVYFPKTTYALVLRYSSFEGLLNSLGVALEPISIQCQSFK